MFQGEGQFTVYGLGRGVGQQFMVSRIGESTVHGFAGWYQLVNSYGLRGSSGPRWTASFTLKHLKHSLKTLPSLVLCVADTRWGKL